jgi:hypothetical protein
MKKIIFFLLFPFLFYGQDSVLVTPIQGRINTNNAELSFIQINDTLAFFSAINETNRFQSSIYYSIKKGNKWGKRKYSKYNSDNFDTGDITFLNENNIVFTSCNSNSECELVSFQKGKYYTIKSINSKGFKNTQAHFAQHNSQAVLYFVSDREGGFGGLDIWMSMLDKDGNFGIPINAGNKVNSMADEITPFFNTYDGHIYFSSNRKNGIGGFDIYKAEGKLNLWDKTKNVKELNTLQDEMYLYFYNSNTGYLASNRKGAKFENTEYCCNDIFSFEYLPPMEDTSLSDIHSHLPLVLYFHNADPDCCTMDTTTTKTYKDAYISYFKMKDEYEQQNVNLSSFFERELQANFNSLNIILNMLLSDLVNGHKMNLQIKGFASPLYNPAYNQALSQRRISSVINYLQHYNNGVFTKYIQSQYLSISELPFGESTSSEKVSDDPADKVKSIYSLPAILERRIEIVDIKLVD